MDFFEQMFHEAIDGRYYCMIMNLTPCYGGWKLLYLELIYLLGLPVVTEFHNIMSYFVIFGTCEKCR